MSWSKLSDDYPDRLEYLSDAAFRLHTEALCLVMKRELGPWLPRKKLLRSTNVCGDVEAALAELLSCGFMVEREGGIEVVEHMEHQPSAEQIKTRRMADARRQHAKRERDRLAMEAKYADHPKTESRSESHRDVPRDYGSGRDGSGRDGKNSFKEGKSHDPVGGDAMASVTQDIAAEFLPPKGEVQS